MTALMVCWKCGASIEDLPLPLARLAECLSCRAYLHVCRMCGFYDPRVAKACREPIADEVQDKGRANFCGYFQARPGAYLPRDEAAVQTAQTQLDALFGALSGSETNTAAPKSEVDAAREQLKGLFRSNNKREE